MGDIRYQALHAVNHFFRDCCMCVCCGCIERCSAQPPTSFPTFRLDSLLFPLFPLISSCFKNHRHSTVIPC